MKKRYANIYANKSVKNSEQKIISINEKYFTGDIYYYNFIEVKDKWVIPNGVCIMDNNYKWLEFYDYKSKVKLTAIYDENNEIIEWYFDIARCIGKENNVPFEDDLYLDVVLRPNGETVLLDEDELKEAYQRMEITKEEYDEAYKIANELINKVKKNEVKVKEFTDKYLKELL